MEALEQEEERLNNGWYWPKYKYAGMYAKQLKRYYQYFNYDKIKVIKFDNFKESPKRVLIEPIIS